VERRRDWDERVIRMNAERLVKLSIYQTDNFQDFLEEDGAT
jgi:hypothetical protein